MSVTDLHLLSVEEVLANMAEDIGIEGESLVGVLKLSANVRKIIVWMAALADQLGLREIANSLPAMTLSEVERFIKSIVARMDATELPPEPTMLDLDGRSTFRAADKARAGGKQQPVTMGRSLAD